MEKSNKLEQIELGLEKLSKGVKELKEEGVEDTKPQKTGTTVPIKVSLTTNELKLISKIRMLIIDCGDYRNCSRADVLRLALQLLDIEQENEILGCFDKIKSFDGRTTRRQK